MSKATQKEIERLYGEMQGLQKAKGELLTLAKELFMEGADDKAVFLREIALGQLNDVAIVAEDAWREADPNAQPRKS